jgi:hypothetical protein
MKRFVAIGHGETELPVVADADTLEGVLSAVLDMIYFPATDCPDSEREAYRATIEDAENWHQGTLEIKFEIGGIRVHDTGVNEPRLYESDAKAIDGFAVAMKEKMAHCSMKGRAFWQQTRPEVISMLLRQAVEKGDPVDVADYAMMLWHMGAPINSPVVTVSTALSAVALEGIKATFKAAAQDAQGGLFS